MHHEACAAKLVVDNEPVSQVRIRVAPERPAATYTPSNDEIKAFLPVVEKEAARFLRRLPRSVQKDDLVSAGTIGLLDALRRNAGPRDARFEHYVRIRVRGAILDELRREDWLSRGDRERLRACVSAASVVHMEDLAEVTAEACSADESPADAAARRMQWDAASDAMRSLPPREREILDMYYLRGWMVKDIAAAMGVSEPRISQLHAQALGRLRSWLATWDEPMQQTA
jgi:RNA polymerase sigma factor for flagellar operon FliA